MVYQSAVVAMRDVAELVRYHCPHLLVRAAQQASVEAKGGAAARSPTPALSSDRGRR